MDIVSKEKRSHIMSRIHSKDTKPEIILRKALFKKGLRYRIHYGLPGKPDIVFVSKKIAIFVNGCFWHGHGCRRDHKPASNTKFWKSKMAGNKERDKNNYINLDKLGWNYYISWECSILNNISNEVKKIISIYDNIP